MSQTKTKLRVFGSLLGEQDTYIDVELGTATLDGEVEVIEVNGSRTWTLPLNTIQSYRDRGLAAKHGNLSHPSHSAWNRVEGLRSDLNSEPFTSAATDPDEMVKAVFTELISVTRNE